MSDQIREFKSPLQVIKLVDSVGNPVVFKCPLYKYPKNEDTCNKEKTWQVDTSPYLKEFENLLKQFDEKMASTTFSEKDLLSLLKPPKDVSKLNTLIKLETTIDPEIVKMVMYHANCDHTTAIKALQKNGNMTDAVIDLIL